jgi:hypothetical protein
MGHCADRLNVLDTKAGALLGDITRYLLAVGLVAGIGMAMGFQPEGGAPGMLAGIGLLLVFALALSWARCSAPASPSTTRNSKRAAVHRRTGTRPFRRGRRRGQRVNSLVPHNHERTRHPARANHPGNRTRDRRPSDMKPSAAGICARLSRAGPRSVAPVTA